MKLSQIQITILSKLQTGDFIHGSIDFKRHSQGWRFDIDRNGESIFIGRIGRGLLKIATIESLVRLGALREVSRGIVSGLWAVTPDGVSLGECEMTVAEMQALSDAIDRRAEQGPL